jgi:nitronate monooxygenase
LRQRCRIGSGAGARRALDLGADYLICQGIEAGGHVQGTSALYDVLPAVIDAAQTVPVLAGGGIANGAHIRRALLAGASGVLVGTRFVATKEAGAHDEYRRERNRLLLWNQRIDCAAIQSRKAEFSRPIA